MGGTWICTFFFLASVMDALTAAAISAFYESVLGKTWFGLYQSPTPVPTPGMLMGNIVECNYTGYARQALVWFPTFIDAAGPQDATAANMHFQPNDSVVPNTATGAFIASAAVGGQLLMAAAFGTPVALTGPSFAANYAPVFQLAYTNNYGNPGGFA